MLRLTVSCVCVFVGHFKKIFEMITGTNFRFGLSMSMCTTVSEFGASFV